MAITVACHVEPVAGSGAVSVVATCHRVVEPHGIHRRKWSRVVAVIAAYQGVQACRSEFGWSVWQREVASNPSERSSESGSRRSPDEVFVQSELGMKPGSCGNQSPPAIGVGGEVRLSRESG